MKPLDLSILSRQRAALMGFAMIYVMLFHVGGFNHSNLWYCLSRCGNIGVDIFLFLSGIGLWFAWTKAPRLKHFYYRRLIRIYPAWLIISGFYYIPRYLDGKLSLTNTILEMAINWGFWEHLELNFWFVPAILLFYILAPFYMKLIIKHPIWRWMPVLVMALELLILYWSPLRHSIGHLEILYSRIPIFLLGINIGEAVKQKQSLEPSTWILVALLFVVSLGVCVNFEDGLRGKFPLFIERWAYIPLAISMMLLVARLFEALPRWAYRGFIFVGGISLEMYLVHIEFILKPIKAYHLGYWLTSLVVIAISAVVAWIIHKIIDFGIKKLPNVPKVPNDSSNPKK